MRKSLMGFLVILVCLSISTLAQAGKPITAGAKHTNATIHAASDPGVSAASVTITLCGVSNIAGNPCTNGTPTFECPFFTISGPDRKVDVKCTADFNAVGSYAVTNISITPTSGASGSCSSATDSGLSDLPLGVGGTATCTIGVGTVTVCVSESGGTKC